MELTPPRPPAATHFQPALDWFASQGWQPFPFQREVWAAYLAGESGLIHAPTGMGKTYAAWLGPLLEWRAAHPPAPPPADGRPNRRSEAPALRVLWVTPLRALAADTAEALRAALEAFQVPWTLETRTGDTSAAVRGRQARRLPSALVTTPESLSLLLARENAPELFSELRLVVVDEWHELLATKRGTQTELALARLRRFAPHLRVWGLSATIGNLPVALQALLGLADPLTGEVRTGRLVSAQIPKTVTVDSLIPDEIERFPWAGHMGLRLLPRLAAELDGVSSALVFTNTRAQTEIWYQALLDARPEWAGIIALHHGSLEPETRAWVEDQLRAGRLRCVVCTSSLDLGVDFSPVERVFQVGSPKGVARLLQRAGRSGHQPGARSRVTCLPTHAFELVEASAARQAMQAGEMEARPPLEKPLDVLVQHLVTVALGGGFHPEDLYREVRTARAYRHLTEAEFAWVLDFVTRGGNALQAYDQWSRVAPDEQAVYRVPRADIARIHRMSIGTIVSDAALTVQFLKGGRLGQVEESFAARLRPGDRFTFAGRILEFVRLRDMTVWVRRSNQKRATVPRWEGARMALSSQLARAVRREVDQARQGRFDSPEMAAVRPVLETQAQLSALPAPDELLVERLRTREGWHIFFYPFEGRLVHEGLAALFATRMARLHPITFTLAANDYGLELLSAEEAPLEEALAAGLLTRGALLDDIIASINASEMARRQFREIARVSGLVFPNFPGGRKTSRQMQASSGLIYEVLEKYDADNLLLDQARREVLEGQLESTRLSAALDSLAAGRLLLRDIRRPTPFAFPLLVDRLRQTVSSEELEERVRKMQLVWERSDAADD